MMHEEIGLLNLDERRRAHMRRLNTKFDTNGSRAIVVPKRFAADIAGKYGPTRRRKQDGRSSLVYRSSMTGKKKPLSVKPATIVRVQVVMPQPTPIVKVQETRVLRERVMVKDSVVTKQTVHREREREKPVERERIVERVKPIVRERIVEREKPIVQERIIEREKPVVQQERIVEREKPIVQERIVEREKPIVQERIIEREKQVVRERTVEREKPIVRERIVERETPISETASKMSQQRNTVAESRQTNARRLRDSSRSDVPIFGRTIAKRGERGKAIDTLFKQQSTARELAFRLLEEEADRSSENPNTADHMQVAESIAKNESMSNNDSIDSRSGRNIIIANRGSRGPIPLEKHRSPNVRQIVSVSSREGASRQWNAVVMINRRTMDRLKTVSARVDAPILLKQTTVRGDKLADRAQEALPVQRANQEALSRPVETRDTPNLHREITLGQNASQRPDSNAGTVGQQAPVTAEHARQAEPLLAQKNETGRGSEPIDKLAVDTRLLDIDSSIDRVSVTMSEAVPSESTFPIALRTIDHLGLTVRLMAARAERLGSMFVLRNRAESGAAEASMPTSSKLVLRRLTENPNTFITARRASTGVSASGAGNAAWKDVERSGREMTQATSAPAHAQPAAPKSDGGPQGNSVSLSDSSASKSLSNQPMAGKSEMSVFHPTSAGQGLLRLTGHVKARLDAPSGFTASAPRAMPTGMIVHASRRGLSVLGRIASRTDTGEAGRATRQASATQPSVAQQNPMQMSTVQPNTLQPNNAQPIASQSNATQQSTAQPSTAQPNATQQSAVQPNDVGLNSGPNVSAANASAIAPAQSDNGISPSGHHPGTAPSMMHPSEDSKRRFENAAQGASDRSLELSHLARLEPTMSDGSGQIPRVRFTFRNRPGGATAPNEMAQNNRASDNQRQLPSTSQVSSTVTPLISRVVPASNQRDSLPKIGNADARPVQLHWIARTSRTMPAARTQPSATNRNGTVANRTAADLVQALHQAQTTNPMQALHPTQMTNQTQPMHPMQTTQSMQPMTHQLLSGTESFPNAAGQPDDHPLVMAPSLAQTALRRIRPSEARQTSAKSNLASAPAAMELRRNAAQPVNAPAEPTPAAVTVEAPPHIDAKQLQKAIEAMPQLNPDQLAERVYTALMKKMKFERRLRGY